MAERRGITFQFPASPTLRCCVCQCSLGLLRSNLYEVGLLCQKCIEEAKSLVALATVLQHDTGGAYRPFAAVMDYIERMQNTASDMTQKISFLSRFVSAFKEQTYTDIQLKPGCNGPSISAHKALLAAKSQVFKDMLDSDGCKAPSTPSDTVTMTELNAAELECLMEFLYSGSLPKEKLEKHVCSLYAAAHKYEISYLQEVCGRHILSTMNLVNAFDIREVAYVCSDEFLKEASLSLILKNMEDLVLTEKYESFALKNPSLCMRITRDLFMKKNMNKN